METTRTSFTEFIECYFDAWNVFAQILLTGVVLPLGQESMSRQRAIPRQLQAEYRLLHLQAERSLAEVRSQYRELAKRYHPDAGGSHADFLALQRACKLIVETNAFGRRRANDCDRFVMLQLHDTKILEK